MEDRYICRKALARKIPAIFALQDTDIGIYGGMSGESDKTVEAFLCGTLNLNPHAYCNHHNEVIHDCGHLHYGTD